ncbi:HNH endonuclease signature motif containing protein [Nocardia asteroides]|uniref:HNH endonuclease signature motif containing protein n=1 Tax=Nocardia asteroides TaxID=1824 RepID=UPI003402DDA0
MRNEDLCSRLIDAIETLEKNSKRYREAAEKGELWAKSPADFPVPSISDKEFEWLYTQKLVAQRSAGRKYYDQLLASALLGRCPYCNHNRVKTIDHFLPKKPFATLAIDPWNLVPCCQECNFVMLDSVATGIEDAGFHPYHEVIVDSWLSVEIRNEDGAAAKFRPRCPADWSSHLKSRVRTTFRKLGLAEMYASAAGVAIAELHHQVSLLHRSGGDASVREHLKEAADSIEAVGPNSWRAVLYRGLAHDDWYCSGGFSAG